MMSLQTEFSGLIAMWVKHHAMRRRDLCLPWRGGGWYAGVYEEIGIVTAADAGYNDGTGLAPGE